jgi:hypothetical protein
MNESRVEFRRLVTPLPTGRVRVQIEVRQIEGKCLLGKIIQARGGWRFVPIGGAEAGSRDSGKVWATAEECKRSVQETMMNETRKE